MLRFLAFNVNWAGDEGPVGIGWQAMEVSFRLRGFPPVTVKLTTPYRRNNRRQSKGNHTHTSGTFPDDTGFPQAQILWCTTNRQGAPLPRWPLL